MSPEDQNAALEVPLGAAQEEGRPGGGTALAFGKYRLLPDQRLLLAGEHPVELKSRAFDVLLTLAEARGALVTREDLTRRVWPTTVVDPHNLDIQISTLRKAFGSDRDLIVTDTGRGYRLAAAVRTLSDSPHRMTNLPAPISVLIGRERELADLEDLVATHRLLTLTGTGGIGKTRLGLEIARRALQRFRDGVWVAEFGPLADAKHIHSTIARAIGIAPGFDRNLLDQLVAALQHKHLLLVLDNCEHVVEAVAGIAEVLLRGAPLLHVLTTSQEFLGAEGEHIYRVSPLKVPENGVNGTAEAIGYSAVRLFVERARAVEPGFALDDRTAAVAGRICRQLDGIPLAIELAAACVTTLGVDVLANRLGDRFQILTGGRRTALKRHQTLSATIEWSYGLLDDAERMVLNRLAVFAGSFTLDGAAAVAAGTGIGRSQVASYITRLVRKSLVTPDIRAPVPRYRLLDSNRDYALAKLGESGEFATIARRHADYYRALMEQAEESWRTTQTAELVTRYAPDIDNLRTALNWALEADDGDLDIGVALTAASVPLWTLLSLLAEYRDLIERALSCRGTGSSAQMRHEMVVQTALGRSSMSVEGLTKTAAIASERALELAEQLDDKEHRLRALYLLWIYRIRSGEYRSALVLAQRFREIAETDKTDLPIVLAGVRLEGGAALYLGDFETTRGAMNRVLDSSSDIPGPFILRMGIDQRMAAFIYLARVLWLQGFPDQALRTAREGIEEGHALDHAYSLCLALSDGACIAAMCGDLPAAEEFASLLADCAVKHGFGVRQVDGLALRGWIALRRGNNALGLPLLRSAIDDARVMRVELRHTIFLEALAQSLAAEKRASEGLAIVQKIFDESSRNDGQWCLAELLRLRGELTLCDDSQTAAVSAEKDFRQAFDLAGRQGARSWQLRAATSLARLWRREGKHSAAREVLVPVYEWFTEGFDTADLKAARALAESLR